MMTRRPTSNRRQVAAFSLMELVVVVVIMGMVASIAVPRLASAVGHASTANTQANIAQLEHVVEVYAAEHEGRSPADELDGSVTDDDARFIKRLIYTSNSDGDYGTNLPLGPYLRDIPANSRNGLRRIRIDGEPAGAKTHGWRFDSILHIFEPDDPEQAAMFRRVTLNADGKPVDAGASVGDAPAAADAGK